jgi:hypothetical protein
MRAFQHRETLFLGDLGGYSLEILAHESRVMTDDQGPSRHLIRSFQIAADRIRYSYNIRECKIFRDYRPPAGGTKSYVHPAKFSHMPSRTTTA